jgi:hypothetical protein
MRRSGRLEAPLLAITTPCFVEVEPDSELRIDRLSLDDGDWLSVRFAGRLELTGSLEFRGATAPTVRFEDAVLAFIGTEHQSIEAPTLDVGRPPFLYSGIGHLIVGAENQATTLQLIDNFQNDARSGQAREALYLTGRHFANTLSILGGSTLRISSNTDVLSVYAIIDNQVVNLKDLFSAPNTVIAFDQGFISNVLAADFNLDGTVDVLDVELLEAALRDAIQEPAYDVTGDSVVDINDLEYLVLDILQAASATGTLADKSIWGISIERATPLGARACGLPEMATSTGLSGWTT